MRLPEFVPYLAVVSLESATNNFRQRYLYDYQAQRDASPNAHCCPVATSIAFALPPLRNRQPPLHRRPRQGAVEPARHVL